MLLVIIVADGARQNDTKWYRAAWSGALDHLRRTTPASVHQVAYRHQLEARMAVVRGNTLESGYMLLVPHTTALAQAEPVTVHAEDTGQDGSTPSTPTPASGSGA